MRTITRTEFVTETKEVTEEEYQAHCEKNRKDFIEVLLAGMIRGGFDKSEVDFLSDKISLKEADGGGYTVSFEFPVVDESSLNIWEHLDKWNKWIGKTNNF